ncbi:MAG: FAD-dependent oxidoreductase [Chloroflexota bacterium]
MVKYPKLFEKFKLGKMEVKNRIVMGEIGARGNAEGYADDRLISFYAARAAGGTGLIIVGGSCIHKEQSESPASLQFTDDKYIPALTKLASTIRNASDGVKVMVQFLHPGRGLYHMHTPLSGQAIGPSAVAQLHAALPREMTVDDIWDVIERYAEGARRAKEAGFDGVEPHGAHSYLIQQFLSPYSNKRTDEWGGDAIKRAKFAYEIIKRTKEKCGQDFVVGFKANGDDFLAEGVPGTHISDVKQIVPYLEKAGMDYIIISSTHQDAVIPWSVQPYSAPLGCLVPFAEMVKEVATVPVGAIGRINNPELAEWVLEKGKADFIGLTRPLICDAEWAKKAHEGSPEDIRQCIGCCTCMDDGIQGRGVKRCAVNPEYGMEAEVRITPTLRPYKVLIVGGGPAGMEAARTAALIGHDVTLWEKEDKLGGQLILAAKPPQKEEFNNLTQWLSIQLEKTGVKVELGKEATPESVNKMNPEVVVIATGATELIPEIPGVDRDNVVMARAVIVGKAGTGQRVVVLGGGQVAMETAQLLARQGKKVTMVVRTVIGKRMVRFTYYPLRRELIRRGVEILQNTRTEEITDAGVVVSDKSGKRQVIGCDTVVLATGAKSERKLLDAVDVDEVHIVGDALYPANILKAIHEGNYIAQRIGRLSMGERRR